MLNIAGILGTAQVGVLGIQGARTKRCSAYPGQSFICRGEEKESYSVLNSVLEHSTGRRDPSYCQICVMPLGFLMA